MELKSFDILLKAFELDLQEKAINQTNPDGFSHAESLVADGKVITPSQWNHPTAAEENNYLQTNGYAEFSKWYLGIDTAMDKETKGHYGYVYTSDFKTVDREGLIAIRKRAAQHHQDKIFAEAGKLIDKIDAKK